MCGCSFFLFIGLTRRPFAYSDAGGDANAQKKKTGTCAAHGLARTVACNILVIILFWSTRDDADSTGHAAIRV